MASLPIFINNFPSRDKSFIGRDDYLSEIESLFNAGENIVLVNGPAGIGKTAIIREFAHRYKEKFSHFVWISEKNGIFENLAADTNLVNNLQVETNISNLANISYRIINKLHEIEGENLLVLDDLEEDFIHFQKTFPLTGNWKILAGSRREFSEIKSIKLKTLSDAETLDLFYKHYSLQTNNELIVEMFQPLSNHPLTIELAAKTAQFHKLAISDLSKRLKSKGLGFSEKTSVSIAHSNTIVEDLGAYYNQIFELESNVTEEIELLRKLAIFPDSFTQINDLFKLLSVSPKNEDNFSYHLNNLVQKGWVENFSAGYRLGQLIKTFIIYKFPLQAEFYRLIVLKLLELLKVDTVKTSPVESFKWLKFGQEIINHFLFETDEIVSLANNLALRYRDNGNFSAARDILEKVLEHDISKYGNGNKITELSRANLGNIYSDLGDYKKAAELLEISLNYAYKLYPKGHATLTARQSNLGLVCRDLGELEKAKKLLEEALEGDLENYPDGNENVAVRQSNLALVYKDSGEYAKARDLLEESIKTALRFHDELHPRIALRFSNLALVYKAIGEYKKALSLLEKALNADIYNFGEIHPKVAVRLMNISTICLEIMEITKAKRSITKSLSIARRTLGESHPDTEAIQKMYNTIFGINY